jgi:hypothetical protein
MNATPDAAPPKRRPWGRRFAAFALIAIRHSSSWLLRAFLTVVLLLLVLFAYLHVVGLPAYLADVFLDRMANLGYPLQIERLTLEIDRGLVARRVRLYAEPLAPEPFLTADSFTVALNPAALLRHRRIEPVLAIENGALKAHLGQPRFGARKGSPSVVADQIHLRFSAAEREIALRDFDARFLGIRFLGRGTAYLPEPAPRAKAARTPPTNPLLAAARAIEEAPDWILRVVEQINAIEFPVPPTADFTFAIFAAHPEANVVSLRIDGPSGAQARGIAFDRFRLDLAWQNRRIDLPDARLQIGPAVLGVSGWWDSAAQTVEADVYNTLPLGAFVGLLPDDLRRAAEPLFDAMDFPLRIEAQIGPAPVARAAETLRARVVASDFALRGVPLRLLDVSLARDRNEILLDDAVLHLASEPIPSRLAIRNGSFRLDTRRFQAAVAGSINPHVVKPWLSENFRNIVDWFDVADPIEGDVVVGGTVGDPAVYVYGPVQARNFAIHLDRDRPEMAVPFRSLAAQLNVTNEVMHMTDATLARPEGVARGEIHMAFSNQTLRLKVDSRLDPRATTFALGPVVADFMQPFRLNGPARVQVEGLLDYCNFSMNQLRARVEAERFGYDRWESDAASFDLAVVGRRLRFDDASATAYGGTFEGRGSLYPVGGDARWRYEADVAAKGVGLAPLLEATLERPMEKLSGTLDGDIRLGGYVGPGTGAGVVGAGRASVRNGFLFETRLLAGLAEILNWVFPELNLFAQTDAEGSFSIRNGYLHSRDVQLKGTVVSAKASGRYRFDGDLDFRVEVQPLRGGAIAALLRIATSPVTRLLEFHLGGTFESPQWRSVNFSLAPPEKPPPP